MQNSKTDAPVGPSNAYNANNTRIQGVPMPTLQIPDMHCESCANRITKALQTLPGVTNIAIDIPAQTAQIEGPANPAALIHAVEKAGYHPQLLENPIK